MKSERTDQDQRRIDGEQESHMHARRIASNRAVRHTAWVMTCVMLGTGCSMTSAGKTAQQPGWTKEMLAGNSAGKLPISQSVTVPGGADVAPGQELQNPSKVHVAYGRWQEQQKQLPQARESYQLALKEDPKSLEALIGLARLEQLGERFSEAEAYLSRAERIRPKDGLVQAAWGEYHTGRKQFEPAIARYRKAIELSPEVGIYHHQLAVLLTKSGDVDGAVAAFSQQIGRGAAYYNVAFLLAQSGDTQRAESFARQALQLEPDLGEAASLLTQLKSSSPSGVIVASAATAALPTATAAARRSTLPPQRMAPHGIVGPAASLPAAASFSQPAAAVQNSGGYSAPASADDGVQTAIHETPHRGSEGLR
jgi:tetratricopeptide (TPR) repeat protein